MTTRVQPDQRPHTPREEELLAATLEVLRETGFDRLTIDEVAARAHASKATVYRRWPSKGDLVVAAFSHGVRQIAVPPGTGTLRGDLMQIGELIMTQVGKYGSMFGGLLVEVRSNPKLEAVFVNEFVHERKATLIHILQQAADRGEIQADVISDEVWDVLSGYLVFRALIPGRPLTDDTVRELIDDVILPSLTRHNPPS
jgi:AcrR family transcriptional regulator